MHIQIDHACTQIRIACCSGNSPNTIGAMTAQHQICFTVHMRLRHGRGHVAGIFDSTCYIARTWVGWVGMIAKARQITGIFNLDTRCLQIG